MSLGLAKFIVVVYTSIAPAEVRLYRTAEGVRRALRRLEAPSEGKVFAVCGMVSRELTHKEYVKIFNPDYGRRRG